MVEKLEEHPGALRFHCLRCAALHFDDYEVLDVGVASAWRCHRCERMFTLQLIECGYCSAEAVEVALAATELARVNTLSCLNCGKRLAQREEAQAESDFG